MSWPKADSERETSMKILCLNNVSSMVSSQSRPLSHITAHIVLTGQAGGETSAVHLVLMASLTAGP